MYNRLISRAHRRSLAPDDLDESRCSGKTTQVILFALAEAIENARLGVQTPVSICDPDCKTMTQARLLLEHTNRVIAALGLKFMYVTIKHANGQVVDVTVKSNLFTTNQWDIE